MKPGVSPSSRTPWTDAEVSILRRLHAQNLNSAQIAKRMRLPYQRVRDKVRQITADHSHEIKRQCLCCGKSFLTDSRFLRLCPTHRMQSA